MILEDQLTTLARLGLPLAPAAAAEINALCDGALSPVPSDQRPIEHPLHQPD